MVRFFIALLLVLTLAAVGLAQQRIPDARYTTTEGGITYTVELYRVKDDPKVRGYGVNWDRLAQAVQQQSVAP